MPGKIFCVIIRYQNLLQLINKSVKMILSSRLQGEVIKRSSTCPLKTHVASGGLACYCYPQS